MSIVKRTISILERIAPLRLAERWDNVGLLLEPYQARQNARRILLTIDLTNSVVDEAIRDPSTGIIVSYHPPIFPSLTSLTLRDPMQKSILMCASAGIAVYSPHTALDSVNGGVNDWLAKGLVDRIQSLGSVSNIREIQGEEAIAGQGRKISFEQPVLVDDIVKGIKSHLSVPNVQLASPPGSTAGSISTVAICAGSGGSMFKGVQADLYWTGEMSHHEVLAAVGRGSHVVLCGHTNTERGFLATLRGKILEQMHATASDAGEPTLEVGISGADAHPLATV